MLWKTLVAAYDSALELIVVNGLWLALTLPVITAPGAAAGLYYYTYQLTRGERVTWQTFFEGFRLYGWPTSRWFLLNAVIVIAAASSYSLYGRIETAWAEWLQAFLPILLLLWLLLQVYVLPLLFALERPSVRAALRLSLLVYLRQPGCSLALLVLMVALGALSSVLILPWLILTMSLYAMLINRVAANGLASLMHRAPPP